MGTRSDFYVMNKKKALIWVGSYGWDGDPEGVPKDMSLDKIDSEEDFKKKVIEYLEEHDGYISGKNGWPWPWEDSGTTDYYYFFYEGDVWCGGIYVGEGTYTLKLRDYMDNLKEFDDGEDCEEQVEKKAEKISFKGEYSLPDMSKIQDVDFGRSSGVMVFGSKPSQKTGESNAN